MLGKAGYSLFLISAGFNPSIFLTLHQLLKPARLPAAGSNGFHTPTRSLCCTLKPGTEGVGEHCWGGGRQPHGRAAPAGSGAASPTLSEMPPALRCLTAWLSQAGFHPFTH